MASEVVHENLKNFKVVSDFIKTQPHKYFSRVRYPWSEGDGGVVGARHDVGHRRAGEG
jgi:hypothetical protein